MATTFHLKRKRGRKAKIAQENTNSAPTPSTPRPREYAHEFNRYNLVQIKFRDRLGRLCSLGEGFPTDVPTVMLGGAAPAERIGEAQHEWRV